MQNWGLLTWLGVLVLVVILLIYYQGAGALTNSGAAAFGSTVSALTGNGKPQYASNGPVNTTATPPPPRGGP